MQTLTGHWAGLTALIVFVAAYAAVMAEERLHLRKSVPVLVAAAVIWPALALAAERLSARRYLPLGVAHRHCQGRGRRVDPQHVGRVDAPTRKRQASRAGLRVPEIPGFHHSASTLSGLSGPCLRPTLHT